MLFIIGEETHADKAQIVPKYEFSFTQHILKSFPYLTTVKWNDMSLGWLTVSVIGSANASGQPSQQGERGLSSRQRIPRSEISWTHAPPLSLSKAPELVL